ncbi:hypothetical protein OAL27_00655 [Verrucomicrobiales bacterium]|jgi:hypothetical protein|nr:hypothetical protein [bacterium]MDC0312442.1 hypothetical protein [Verrucomicrobiales bacterium]
MSSHGHLNKIASSFFSKVEILPASEGTQELLSFIIEWTKPNKED